MKFCVIGLGRFGYQVSLTLADNGMEVLSIDGNESLVASIKDMVTQAVCMQVADEESLRAVGVDEMDAVIVAMGESFAESILLTALLKKKLQVPLVIARATDSIHEDILKLVGADQVVLPEREMGVRIANNLSLPFVDLVNVTDSFAITQIKTPSRFVGKSITELQLRRKYNVACIGVKKGSDIILVGQEYVILENDNLVFAGENKHLASLTQL
jgi:trk system potassium uptake protein TrkA